MKPVWLACAASAGILAACGSSSPPTAGPASDASARQSDDAAAVAMRANLGGLWVRTDETGSGSFDAMFAGIKPPELLPEAKAIMARRQAERQQSDQAQLQKSGNVYKVAAHCNPPGIIFMMQHSGAFDIVLQKDEILVVPEHPGAQVIYMDGRAHPSPDRWTPLGTGHSVGRWDGAALVVSTVGMRDDGTPVPGGGLFTPVTELLERFELASPTRLRITFTWTDPRLYAKPHSYAITYAKQPEGSDAFESWCDVSDPVQAQSVVLQPQS